MNLMIMCELISYGYLCRIINNKCYFVMVEYLVSQSHISRSQIDIKCSNEIFVL